MGEVTEEQKDLKQKDRSACTSAKCLAVIAVVIVLGITAAVLLILLPAGVRQRTPPTQQWWQKTIVYQIYPRSFQDSDGDGVGDLQGIISRLDYFNFLGVGAIWISPAYQSPMVDFGYDISDFTNIDPMFGSLETMKKLIDTAHEKGLKVILDFVPNHSSDQHPWFTKSVQRQDPYTDFYIWTDTVPNNWNSVFGGSAWSYNDVRKQYYYHAFVPQQPDLNYRNPAVREEMKKVVRFWMAMGIDGLRVDAIVNLFETTNLTLNEPRGYRPGYKAEQWEYLDHLYTCNLPEISDVITEWRQVMDEFVDDGSKEDDSKFMVVEVYEEPAIRNVYYTNGADMPFNMDLVAGTEADCNATCMYKLIEKEYRTLPEGKWPNFVMGNHDRQRLTSKRGKATSGKTFTNVLNMLLLTLKGTPTCYYGDELGMEDVTTISVNETQDPFGKKFPELSRDPERTPMQWTTGPNAGFTNATSTPWLPLNANHSYFNVEYENSTDHTTPLKVYRQLAKLRQEPAFLYGRLDFRHIDDDIISYVRATGGHTSYLIVLNVGTGPRTMDFHKDYQYAEGTVVVTSGNFDHDRYKVDSVIKLDKVTLEPAEGFIVSL